MKTIQATKYITQLTWFGIFNAFLVRETDGFTLVDTMVKGNAERIVKCARLFKLPIVRIAITHAHSDHVGSLEALASKLPKARRLISGRDVRFLAGERRLDQNEPQKELHGNFQTVRIPMESFEEGDMIGSLRVVATPGHTPGHVCFVDVRDNTLLAGDAYSTLNGVATSARTYVWFPPPGLYTWDRDLAQQSAKKLLALNPSLLLAGHGNPVSNPVQKMAIAVGESER